MINLLKFILGPAGSGKSHYIRKLISEKLEAGIENIMLIVPEQITFENERSMLSFMGEQAMNKLLILSLTRLVDFVFSQIGGIAGSKDRLNEIGRNVLMNLSFWEIQDQLELYKNQIEKIEFTELVLTVLCELKKCNISYEQLIEHAYLLEDKELSKKLREVALIIGTFEALVEKNYVDPLDELTRLANKLKDVNFFKGYTIFIDSFSSFSMQELDVLRYMLTQADDVYISLCIDDKELLNEYSLFSGTVKTKNKLVKIAKEEGIRVVIDKNLKDRPRFKNKDLEILSSNIYASKCLSLSENPENVFLYNASNQYDESQFVARSIKKLIFEHGYRYRDITVITRNIEDYSGIIDIIFNNYEIPYFIDIREKIDSRPIMNTVLTAFDIVIKNYQSEDIFKYLKNGLINIEIDEIAQLENYVLMWKLNAKDWLSEFKKHPRGYVEEFTDKDKIHLSKLNELRLKIITPLVDFSKNIKDSSGFKISEEVYNLLLKAGVDEALKKLSNDLKESGELNLAREELRLWDILMEILNQLAVSIGNKLMDEKKFAKLLRLAIFSADMASIPSTLDQVQIGVAGRSHAHEPKVVFIIGANEGEFPRVSLHNGLFSDSQRRKLIASGLEIYDHMEQYILDERFIAYMSLSMASERLYVSFLSSDVQSNVKSPSSIVRQIKRVFPKLQTSDEFCFNRSDYIWAIKPTFELMAKYWKQDDCFSNAIKNYFCNQEKYRKDLERLEIAGNKRVFKFKDKEVSKQFFGEKMKLSASQIEKYYLCRFQYFCKYGLNAKERKTAQINALEYGSIMHYIFENIFRDYTIELLAKLSSKEINRKVEQYLSEYVCKRLGGWEDKSARFKFQFKCLVNTATTLILHMITEFSQSEFEPRAFELSIAYKGAVEPLTLKLPDGNKVIIEGKVDRLDLMTKNDLKYVRIVDYKTGIKEFKLSDVLYGINMQMLLYMDAILKNNDAKYRNLVPAGILYMPSNQPLVNTDRNEDTDKIKSMQVKKMKMNGLVLDNPVVVNGMEDGAKGIFIPAVIKDGEVSNSESVASLALFGALLKKVEKLVINMASCLRDGDIKAEPKKGEYDACKWCAYKSVCGFEEGDPVVKVVKMNKTMIEKELCIKKSEVAKDEC